ncbi:uncharacterized protein CTRU02_201322 [Colletotrichum truncatum]|uniref:Uncharacterized protein n=1 Tax=Colletotrichum truncatum TaxID=5467 RepID=A0ACC3ZH04_COLTU|nr:uncharacterized protein CTRU02_08114 [Colletotrichum truncatum]KAF6790594.1 hypothetical protein CTRU02_08114 [Colletotrichum truncatum]
MAVSAVDLDDFQMRIDDGQTQLNTHPLPPLAEEVTVNTGASSPNTSKGHLSSPDLTSRDSLGQTSRQDRHNDCKVRWFTHEKTKHTRSSMTPTKASPNGIEKRKSSGKRKTKATDARLSSELDRLLVGDGPSASPQQDRSLHRIQHPLRAVLHSLPGFMFDEELDNIKFRKHQRVLVGVEGLMMDGGKDAAKEWLEKFLLLIFETKAEVLKRYPMCRELDDVPLGFITLAKDVETIINNLPYDPALKIRRTMERRLCQSYDMRRLVEWTIRARWRFLQSKPKIVPGFGAFGQKSSCEGTELEKRLWAAVDARGNNTAKTHND